MFSCKYDPCNICDILRLKSICCSSEIQIEMIILYVIWQLALGRLSAIKLESLEMGFREHHV